MKKPNSATHGNHVWVRQDLVEAILANQGQMPAQWKPRKRNRGDSSWGWCRAVVNHQDTNLGKATKDNAKSPYGAVALRSVASPNMRSPNWKGSPAKEGKQVIATLTIEDAELAPHLHNEMVRLSYKTSDEKTVCTANAWWLTGDDQFWS